MKNEENNERFVFYYLCDAFCDDAVRNNAAAVLCVCVCVSCSRRGL